MMALAAPALIAAVRDLANPKGLLRQFGSALLGKKRTEDQRNIRQNVEYTISDSTTNAMSQDADSKSKAVTS
ncbi:MAG: hypothetical protein JW699_08275 [Chitinispirillaceae bacterium]|nr:hypothetical protein [Chitinispirillaceae bacterium]